MKIKPLKKCVPPDRRLVEKARTINIPTGQLEEQLRNAEIHIRVNLVCTHHGEPHRCPHGELHRHADTLVKSTTKKPERLPNVFCKYQESPVRCYNADAIMDAVEYGFIVDQFGGSIDANMTVREFLLSRLKQE